MKKKKITLNYDESDKARNSFYQLVDKSEQATKMQLIQAYQLGVREGYENAFVEIPTGLSRLGYVILREGLDACLKKLEEKAKGSNSPEWSFYIMALHDVRDWLPIKKIQK